ncbi:MAG: hypothetical protein QOI98_47 [Solirubrobacteraceae bacterium]|jgi:hypothetical protein|nr:hypothetical protein [Solirubrobacteraceae bacterium]
MVTTLGSRRRGVRGRLLAWAAAALLLAGAVAAVILLSRDKGAPNRAATAPAVSSPAARARTAFPAGSAFVDAGVRFEVVASPRQAWSSAVAALAAGPGQRWQTVSVIYRNLSQRDLTVERLRFRLQDGRGRVYLPDAVAGNHGTELPAGANVPVGKLVHGRLAFRVRTDARSLSLLIDATQTDRARVPLGAS